MREGSRRPGWSDGCWKATEVDTCGACGGWCGSNAVPLAALTVWGRGRVTPRGKFMYLNDLHGLRRVHPE